MPIHPYTPSRTGGGAVASPSSGRSRSYPWSCHGDDGAWDARAEPWHRIPDAERTARVGCDQAEDVGNRRNGPRQRAALLHWWREPKQRSEGSCSDTPDHPTTHRGTWGTCMGSGRPSHRPVNGPIPKTRARRWKNINTAAIEQRRPSGTNTQGLSYGSPRQTPRPTCKASTVARQRSDASP
jgi:hypothetical protein